MPPLAANVRLRPQASQRAPVSPKGILVDSLQSESGTSTIIWDCWKTIFWVCLLPTRNKESMT